ncbi:MAG TPA: hypothetical protein VKP14_02400 [Gaiellaceae bacterium]|nr:hypothetical protein [Gaiellaceae bacterium]
MGDEQVKAQVTQVAGLPCVIDAEPTGDWVVTLASVTIARSRDLAQAIADAGGGFVSRAEAEEVAASVTAQT